MLFKCKQTTSKQKTANKNVAAIPDISKDICSLIQRAHSKQACLVNSVTPEKLT
jgi:hypothetical protein